MQDIDIVDLKRISDLIYERHRYDFRNYAVSSFRRRVARILELKKLSVPCLIHNLSETPHFIDEFINELTVNVTEMFRDPGFWNALRTTVLPELCKKNETFRIWHAGCSSGEEVLTMCILLEEEGLLDRALITATDLDAQVLRKARSRRVPVKNMEVNEKNYLDTGIFRAPLDRFYTRQHSHAVFHRHLVRNVSFLEHDLVVGNVFGSFDLILCRNVMIYFNQALQNEVLKKFYRSLNVDGFLSIGSKESLIWCDYGSRFTALNTDEKIYQKLPEPPVALVDDDEAEHRKTIGHGIV